MQFFTELYTDYDDVRFYLGSYTDLGGAATVLISIEAGLDEDVNWVSHYHVRALFYRPTGVSLSVAVEKSLRLLKALPPGEKVVSYSNQVNQFFGLLRARGEGKLEDFWVTRIDSEEGYRILQDLISTHRLTLEPCPGVEKVGDILRNIDIEGPLNPLVGALYHSVCVIERNRLRNPGASTPIEIFSI